MNHYTGCAAVLGGPKILRNSAWWCGREDSQEQVAGRGQFEVHAL